MRLLLLLCRVLLLATLLFWVLLLWDQPDPEEKRCQQEWSISVSRFTGFHDCPLSEERWHTLQMTIRTGCCFLMIVLTFHLITFAQALGAALDDVPPTPPLFLDSSCKELCREAIGLLHASLYYWLSFICLRSSNG